jgi:cobalt-zinc-cadmium resistance protein CzcA
MVFTFSQPIQCRIDELVAGTRAQIIVKFYGEEMNTLNQKAQEIAEVLSRVRGAIDLIVERVAGQPYISIIIDRNKIARHGVNVRDVLDVIEIAVGGKAATKIYQENRSFDLVVRFQEERRNSAQAIGNILIKTNQGYSIPLSQLAEISTSEGPVQISRENGQRRIGVELNIKGRDIGSFVAEAKKKIRENVSLPGGYYVTWGGQFENQQRAMKRLTVIVPIVIVLIFFFLTTTFGSLKLASLIILNLPFALVGGVFSLYASGLYLSVPASIGFIALFGIAVLNGIVLVSYISQLRKEEESLQAAIVKGCEIRLRPVLITATITVFSLIPLIFATGPGSEVQRPLAVVVVGGLITSTLLTLVVLPVLYSLFDKKKN